MDVQTLTYLARYPLIILCGLFIWPVFRISFSELRYVMRKRATPVQNFFLLAETDHGPKTGSHNDLRGLALYTTTFLGRSKTCDIRLTRKDFSRREAVIYLYDGLWFVRPAHHLSQLKLNGQDVNHPTHLQNKDIISLSDLSFTFIDERVLTDQDQPVAATEPSDKLSDSAVRRLSSARFAVMLFSLSACVLTYLLIPPELKSFRQITAIFLIGCLVLFQVVSLVMKASLKRYDELLTLSSQFLAFTGLMLQIRLAMDTLPRELPETEIASITALLLSDLLPQAASLTAGLLLLPVIAVFTARSRLLEPLSLICVVLTPLLLILTLIFGWGAETHGATLWINIDGLSVQLTELAKISFLIVLASIFKHRPPLRTQLFFAVWAACNMFLIMLLPDLGLVMVLLPTTLIVYVVMTSSYLNAILMLLGSSVLSGLAYSFFPHVQRRLAGWTTLWTEINDNNRQIVYGLQAIARGGLLGRGLGNGSPGGIPLASSDMIFSIVGEELGFLFGVGIVIIFMVFWMRSARTAVIAQDGFSSSLALSAGTLIFFQAFVVITGVTGLLPLTGKTVPLLAKGGSSVVSVFLLIGLLIGLAGRNLGTKRK